MIKKLLVAITLVAVVVACGDKKKDNNEAQYVKVCALVESADSLVALDEVTLVGKLGLCSFTKEDVVLAGKGVVVKVVPAEGVLVDTLLFGKAVAVTGKLSVDVLDSVAVAELEAKLAEHKATCAKACEKAKEEQKTEEVAEVKDGEAKECHKKEEKSCCSAPKAGNKVYTVTVTKIEEFECPDKGDASQESEEKKEYHGDGEKAPEEQVSEVQEQPAGE
jgi:hypothetical protein